MKLAILAILAGFIFLAGCTQEPPPVHDFLSAQGPLIPNPQENQAITNQSEDLQNSQHQSEDLQNDSQSDSNESQIDSNESQEINPAEPQTPPQPPIAILDCQILEPSQIAECAAQLAIEEKNVSLCIYLESSNDRFSCITRWCLSASRDFTQCETLASIDERLGCLNKCNLNPNR